MEMNCDFNMVVIFPTAAQSAQELSKDDATLECNRLQLPQQYVRILDDAGVPVPQRAQFYRGTISAEHLNRKLYDKLFRDVLREVKRASMIAVRLNSSMMELETCKHGAE